VHEGTVNWATVLGQEFGQFFLALGQRRAAFTGPDKSVQRQPGDPLRVPFSE